MLQAKVLKKIAKLLRDNNSDMNIQNNNGATALEIANLCSDGEIIELLSNYSQSNNGGS